MAAEDYHDMYDYYDQGFLDRNLDMMPAIKKFHQRVKEHMSKNKYENNKFYIGSDTIFGRTWGHRTLNECIKHAQQVMDEQSKDEVFIVKIVKVVRRKAAPIEVIDVK